MSQEENKLSDLVGDLRLVGEALANNPVYDAKPHFAIIIYRAAEALSRRASAGGEAVAWQAKGSDGVWRYVEMPRTAAATGMELRPLYAAPSPSPAPADVVERLRGALADYDADLAQTLATGLLRDREAYGEEVSGVMYRDLETLLSALHPAVPDVSEEWQSMDSAPKDATEVLLRIPATATRQPHVMVGHWACDMSGEEQPPFRGWFYNTGHGFAGIEPKPSAWAPLPLSAAQGVE